MSRLERNEEWVRFQETVEQAAADNVGRLSKHVDTLVEVASELETFQAAVGERAKERLDRVKRDLRSTEVKLERLGIAMKTLTSDLQSDVKRLLAKIDNLVRHSFDEELDSMPALIHEFSPSSLASTGSALFPSTTASFFRLDDPAVTALYKQHLSRHVETTLKENLRNRLGRQVSSLSEVAQLIMTEKITKVLPSDDEGVRLLDMTPHKLPPLQLNFPPNFDSCFLALWRDFREDVDFKFSLRPQNILSRTKMLKLRAKNFVEAAKGQQQDQLHQGTSATATVRPRSSDSQINQSEFLQTTPDDRLVHSASGMALEAGANADYQIAISGTVGPGFSVLALL